MDSCMFLFFLGAGLLTCYVTVAQNPLSGFLPSMPPKPSGGMTYPANWPSMPPNPYGGMTYPANWPSMPPNPYGGMTYPANWPSMPPKPSGGMTYPANWPSMPQKPSGGMTYPANWPSMPPNPHGGMTFPANGPSMPPKPHGGMTFPANGPSMPPNPHGGMTFPANGPSMPPNPHGGMTFPANGPSMPPNPHGGMTFPANGPSMPPNPHGGMTFPANGPSMPPKPHGGMTFPANGPSMPPKPHGGMTFPANGPSMPRNPHGGMTFPANGPSMPPKPQGGFTLPGNGPSMPPNPFGGLTLPANIPSMPALPSIKPIVPTGSPVPASFPCPKECQSCQLFKDKTKVCMAFDDFGVIKQKFYSSWLPRTQDDYDFLSNTSLFTTTAYMSTCDGIEFYMKTWAVLKQKGKDDLLGFIRDPRTVSVADLRLLPKVPFAILESIVERNMFQLMNKDQKLVMCEGLEYIDCFTRVAIDRNIDCARILLASGTADAKTIASLVDVRNCSNWDKEQWNLTMKYSPDILDMDCLKIAPPDVMVDNIDSLAQHCHKLDKREINILANITTSKMLDDKRKGTPVSSDEKDKLADLLSFCGADPAIMGDLMDKSEMLSKVDYSKTDTKEGIKFMKEVLETVDPKDLTKDQIVNSFKMMVYNRSLLAELDTTELENAVCEICDKADDFDSADLAKLADVVLKRVPSLADPSTYDDATIDCIGPLIQFLPMQSFDNIPSAAMESAISGGKMKNVTVTSKSMGKKLLESAKTALGKTNGDFTSADLEKLGTSVVAMVATDLKKIPDASFSDSIIEMFADNIMKSDVSPPKSMIAALMEKAAASATGVKAAIESGLGDDVPTELLKNADLSDLPDITGESSEVTIEVDTKRAKILVKKVKDSIGDLGGADTNFTLQRLANMEKIACGLTVADIKNISRDGECVDKMNAITKSQCIEKEQVDAAVKAFKEATNFDSSTTAEVESNTDSATLSQSAPNLLAQLSYAEMKKYGTSNKDAIVSTISQADTEVLSKTQMKDGFKFVMDSVGKTTSGEITKDDLDTAGNMVCGIDSTALDRLDADALEEYATTIEKCSLGSVERKALGSAVMKKLDLNDGSKVDATSIMTLGTSVAEMSDTQLDAIDKSVLCDMSDKVVKSFKDKEEKETKRKMKGFKMDTSTADDTTFKTNKKRVMKKLLAVQDACSSTSSASAGRRKRSTTSLTCSYMTSIGTSGLSAITVDQINNLDDTEFTDCIDILGAVTDYSTDQIDALVTVGKRNTVWGDPTTWTATTVYSAGVIVQGLTVSEIGTLALDLDAVSKLGEYDGWTDAQKNALFERWLTLEKSDDASTITSSELRSLGHMTCGAETGHIDVISHSVYSSAADAVGEVTSCSDGQLSSFITLAKSAYGSDITTWDSTTITNIGIVIGGLTSSDMSTLSESQIDAIDSNHVSYIPSSTFAGLTTTQINTLSVSQAQSTTTVQRSALDSSQLAALSSVANTTFSGCDMMQMSWTFAVFLALLSMYFGQN
ncbi:uncharacterized protein LOC143044873 [Mytilus galloprovincialis]|uniref:uncharacterized protein LOC143044873 n=1 Tax=Mytilus galloprovincialis TaxID=29158 RepID=UPI003F7C7A92